LTTIIRAAITITTLVQAAFATALAQAGGSPAVAVLKTPLIQSPLTVTQFKVATVTRATVTGPSISGAAVAAATIFGAAFIGCLGWLIEKGCGLHKTTR
jgi:formaldehyde-activating enzyme involved in methanogenesis